MPSLPTKGIKGQNFKAWAVDSINKLIDYLSSPYLTPGQGINIRRTPSGTVIELQKQPEPVQQNINISGGTSSVNGMVYPDWSQQPFSGIYANSPFTLTDGDAWLYVYGTWESSSGHGSSSVSWTFSLNGHSNEYPFGSFHSDTSGMIGYFYSFLPVKKGTTVTLNAYTSSIHTMNIIFSGLFEYRNQ